MSVPPSGPPTLQSFKTAIDDLDSVVATRLQKGEDLQNQKLILNRLLLQYSDLLTNPEKKNLKLLLVIILLQVDLINHY